MHLIFIFLAVLALLASLLCFALLYDTSQYDESRLMKLGIKLILNAGLLLASLRYAINDLNQKSLIEENCSKLFDLDMFNQAEKMGCTIEKVYSIDWSAFLLTSAF